MEFAELNLLKKKPRIKVQRFDDNSGNRFYYWKQRNKVHTAAGITTVLASVMPESKHLTDWKIKHGANWKRVLRSTAEYGTMLHILYLEWVKNKFMEPTDYIATLTKMEEFCAAHTSDELNSDMPGKDLLAFIKFMEDRNVKPLLMEAKLISEPVYKTYYAMTIDFLVELDLYSKEEVVTGVFQKGKNKGKNKTANKKTTKRAYGSIDFKSNYFNKDSKSFYDGHKYQLIGAKKAIEHNFNIKVEYTANFAPVNWRTEPSYSLYEHKIDDKDLLLFNKYIDLAYIKGNFKPNGQKLIIDNYDNSKNFKYLWYDEFVKEKLI